MAFCSSCLQPSDFLFLESVFERNNYVFAITLREALPFERRVRLASGPHAVRFLHIQSLQADILEI